MPACVGEASLTVSNADPDKGSVAADEVNSNDDGDGTDDLSSGGVQVALAARLVGQCLFFLPGGLEADMLAHKADGTTMTASLSVCVGQRQTHGINIHCSLGTYY